MNVQHEVPRVVKMKIKPAVEEEEWDFWAIAFIKSKTFDSLEIKNTQNLDFSKCIINF